MRCFHILQHQQKGQWCSRKSSTLVQMRRQRPNKRWYGLLYFVIGEINVHLWCYIVITNGEEEYMQKNYSVTCIPWQSHYFHCPWTSPSGGGASCVHRSTTRRGSVLSLFRRQNWLSLLSFLPKGGLRQCTCLPILKTPPPSVVEASCFHSLTMCQLSVSVSKYCCLFILYVSSYIMIFLIRLYLWYTLFICCFLLCRLFLFLLCVYCYSILLKSILSI